MIDWIGHYILCTDSYQWKIESYSINSYGYVMNIAMIAEFAVKTKGK